MGAGRGSARRSKATGNARATLLPAPHVTLVDEAEAVARLATVINHPQELMRRAAVAEAELELAGYEGIGQNAYKTVFRDGEAVYKIPNIGGQGGEPIENCIYATLREAAHAEMRWPLPIASGAKTLPMPLAQLHWHATGIPIIAMEFVDTDLGDEKLPDWVGGLDHGQVGRSRGGKLVPYDIDEPPVRALVDDAYYKRLERKLNRWLRKVPESRQLPVVPLQLQQFLEENGASLELLAVMGSHAYGLATPDSDRDYRGIYRLPLTTKLGVHKTRPESFSVIEGDDDIALHELGRFAALAAEARPNALELFFAVDREEQSAIAQRLRLRATSSLFLSQRVRDSHLGFSNGHIKNLARRKDPIGTPRRQKAIFHAFRVLEQGQELLKEGSTNLWLPGQRRDRLWELAEQPLPKILAEYKREAAVLQKMRTKLPAEPAWGKINRLLVELYQDQD